MKYNFRIYYTGNPSSPHSVAKSFVSEQGAEGDTAEEALRAVLSSLDEDMRPYCIYTFKNGKPITMGLEHKRIQELWEECRSSKS